MAAPSSSCKHSCSERETSAASNKLYDAFINHRGPDMKDTVAFALYDSLEEKGFWTFLDVQELRAGDSIKSAIDDAIYSSAVQIAIFSPKYAESPWCLDELVDMLKTQALFIPVFCDVEPYDVRYPEKGVYKDAFAEHERKERISKDMLQEWKGALHSSSLISGYEFSTSNDDVGTLCEKIAKAVEEVVGKTSKGFPRSVEVERNQICLGADTGASTSTSGQVNKKSSLLPRDSHPVGIDSKVEDMLRLLRNTEYPVIAVVGMGGWGKTFLLQNVYKKAKSSFEISIWLSVSKSYSVQKLQSDIANRIRLPSEIVDGAISEVAMAEWIHGRLQGKRCLIVLDDLWELSTENNLMDKLGLPAHKDFKVVVTTRNKEVAQKSKAHVYEMKNLSATDGWDLFSFYAFPQFKENRGLPHLEEVGREIVEECGSLPLAIKTTAASLANTPTLSKWKSKRDQLRKPGLDHSGGHDPVMDSLRLSYDSLPPHLKPCFAYLSFFPEDEEIEPDYLVYLWIAEGFIPAGDEQLDMAWDWLDKLAQLCLVELWEDTELSDNLNTKCKLHDLLHDLAILISKENRCAFSVEEATHACAASCWCRILLAKKDIDNRALSRCRPPYVRTLSLSQNVSIESIPENMFNAMRGLRVLDLSGTRISALPACVGKMILLKVLNLRDTMINELPECVRNLKGLLFLAMREIEECEECLPLPEWITELERLQHLEVPNVSFGPKVISKMVSLRVLRIDCIELPIEEDLAKLTHLRDVMLDVKNDMEVEIVARLVNLRRLELMFPDSRLKFKEYLQFPETMKGMKHLEKLRLQSFAVPSWISDLVSIRELCLSFCEYGHFPEFERMPDLVKLNFVQNRGCKEFPKAFGMSGGFPHLRFLEIYKFADLKEFPQLEEGAMPNLEDFRLHECRNLIKVGEGLELLKRLRSFYFVAEQGLVDLFVEGGEYLNKIRAMNPRVSVAAAVAAHYN